MAWPIAGGAHAQEGVAGDCTACHNGQGDSKRSPHLILQESIHSLLSCTDCHTSISADDVNLDGGPAHKNSAPVVCGECHEDEADVYVKHGRLKIGEDPDLPQCWSCHGSHDVLPSSDRKSHAHPTNLPATCRACHTNMDLVTRHDILRDKPITLYASSVHGQASRLDMNISASCNDCHSALDPDGERTAHRILSPADPESTIYHFNIPDTCGQCHESVTEDYWEGIHGQLVKRGSVNSPVCTGCHGEHGILSHKDPRSPVSAARVAEATCSPCHESVRLFERYGIPGGRLSSYIDSYHGLKSKAGSVAVANCASCHGSHRILPHTDPTSSIHPDNLQQTCGKCHPNISEQLALVPIHETATGIRTGWARFFTVFYLWLIGITIGSMLLHNLADWVRQVKQMQKKPFVIRMTANETVQHWLLMISFIALVVSGFALRFSEAWWVQWLFGWGGGEGFLFRGTIHRASALLFTFCVIWHLVYLFTQRGRRWMRDMLATRRDWLNVKENIQYFLGRRNEKPAFGRFTYMEKCEYWALAWGAIIMIVSGVLLWWDNYFVSEWGLPKGVLDIALVVHYYEAWLATLAILVWHIYGTVFSPSVYPMNPAWLAGRMPKDMYTHEHPEGPKLKERPFRAHDEDEEDPGNHPPENTSNTRQPGRPVQPDDEDTP